MIEFNYITIKIDRNVNKINIPKNLIKIGYYYKISNENGMNMNVYKEKIINTYPIPEDCIGIRNIRIIPINQDGELYSLEPAYNQIVAYDNPITYHHDPKLRSISENISDPC